MLAVLAASAQGAKTKAGNNPLAMQTPLPRDTGLLVPGQVTQIGNGGLIRTLANGATQAIWRLTTDRRTGTLSSHIPVVTAPGVKFQIMGTGTPCDGQMFTSTSSGTVVKFATALTCAYDMWVTNFAATASYQGWSTYITGTSSSPNGAGGYTVSVNVRDYYPQTAGLPTAGGAGVPAGSSLSIAGTGTPCDGAQTTINAQGTANQYNQGSSGYQDRPPYKLQFNSPSPCSFHNMANVGRMAYAGKDHTGNLYLFGENGFYDTSANPNFGLPLVVQIRKSVDGGATWSEPKILFADSTGQCNKATDNCDYFAEDFLQAPDGSFILWHHLVDWCKGTCLPSRIGTVRNSLSFSKCNPNLSDCTVTSNWTNKQYSVAPPPDKHWEAGGIFGLVMPNGRDIAAPLLAGVDQGPEYLAISHDNGETWPQIVPVSDGQSYTSLPTNESTFLALGRQSILGFVRNNGWTAACVNSPPASLCAGPNGADGLLMMRWETTGNDRDWVIRPIAIPLTQPLCGGNSSATLARYVYITPQLVPALRPNKVTLIYGERQYCTGAVTVSYLKAVTFDPELVAAQPDQIGNAQTLDTARASQYIGYGGALQLSPSKYLVTYEKGCPLAYCFLSQNMLTAAPQ